MTVTAEVGKFLAKIKHDCEFLSYVRAICQHYSDLFIAICLQTLMIQQTTTDEIHSDAGIPTQM